MTTSDRKCGVEIEFLARPYETREEMARKLTEVGIQAVAARYSDQGVVPGQWKVKPDGSLSGGNGMELVSPPLQGSDRFDLVTKASAVLLDNGADVNKSCGLHVHVDAGGLNVEAMRKLAAIYIENEPIIDSFLPPSRRGKVNPFAASIRGTNLSDLKTCRTGDDISRVLYRGSQARADRYVKLNFSSLRKHGTVEFRHHSGTVDAIKINQWSKVCMGLIEVALKKSLEPIAAPSKRPRPRCMAVAFDMISRPEGASAEEIRVALNRRTLTSWGVWFRKHNVGFRMSRGRMYLEDAVIGSGGPVTIDSFLSMLEMGDDDKLFWINRAQSLTAQSVEMRP